MKTIGIVTVANDPHARIISSEIEKIGGKCIRINTDEFYLNFEYTEIISNLLQNNGIKLSKLRKEDKYNFHKVWLRRPFEFLYNSQNAQDRLAKSELYGVIMHLIDYLSTVTTVIDHPRKTSFASKKPEQLLLAQKLGFKIPETIITNVPDQALHFFKSHENNIIVKSIDNGAVIHEGKILGVHTTKVTNKMDFSLVRNCPTLFQENIEKKSELRITIIGKKIFAVEFDSQVLEEAKIDWRIANDKLNKIPHRLVNLPLEIQNKLLKLLDHYDLQYGAIDMAITPKGEYVFFEINPAGQFLWLDRVTEGLHLGEEMAKFLLSD